MKKVAIALVALLFVAAFVVCSKVSTKDNAPDAQESVEELESTEASEVVEEPEATISYSEAYNSPDTAADPADVDEDAE